MKDKILWCIVILMITVLFLGGLFSYFDQTEIIHQDEHKTSYIYASDIGLEVLKEIRELRKELKETKKLER